MHVHYKYTDHAMNHYLQIPVEADLPVGENLQDHMMAALDFHDNTTSAVNFEKLASPLPFLQYFTLGSGYDL
jgi:hypothetical protein